jgi:hypothetical protein
MLYRARVIAYSENHMAQNVTKLCGKNAAILIVAAVGTYIYLRYLSAQQDYGYKNNLAISLTESNSGTIAK